MVNAIDAKDKIKLADVCFTKYFRHSKLPQLFSGTVQRYYDLIKKHWLAVIVYSSRLELTKFGWESEPYVTHLLDGFSALSDPDYIIPLPVIFTPKVTSSPNLFSFLPLHQSDKLPPQINFFPHIST